MDFFYEVIKFECPLVFKLLHHTKLLEEHRLIEAHPVFGDPAISDSIDDDERHVNRLAGWLNAHQVAFVDARESNGAPQAAWCDEVA